MDRRGDQRNTLLAMFVKEWRIRYILEHTGHTQHQLKSLPKTLHTLNNTRYGEYIEPADPNLCCIAAEQCCDVFGHPHLVFCLKGFNAFIDVMEVFDDVPTHVLCSR